MLFTTSPMHAAARAPARARGARARSAQILLAAAYLATAAGMKLSAMRDLKANIASLKAAPQGVGKTVRFKLDRHHDLARNVTEREPLAREVAKSVNCANPRRVFRAAGVHEAKHAKHGLDLWYKCDTGEDGKSAVAKLEGLAAFCESSPLGVAVANVEAELKIDLFQGALPPSNDPLLELQPHYPAIHLFEAWHLTRGGPGAVAITAARGPNVATDWSSAASS